MKPALQRSSMSASRQRRIESGIEGFARGEVRMVDDQRGNETRFGAQETLRARHVRHHEDDLGGKVGALQASISA